MLEVQRRPIYANNVRNNARGEILWGWSGSSSFPFFPFDQEYNPVFDGCPGDTIYMSRASRGCAQDDRNSPASLANTDMKIAAIILTSMSSFVHIRIVI